MAAVDLILRYANGAAFLAGYRPADESFLADASAEGTPPGAVLRIQIHFDDTERDFYVHARLLEQEPGRLRLAFVPGESDRKELVLACAEGESVPYFRRRARRVAATLEVRVRLPAGTEIEARTADVSARGLRLLCDHPLAVGTSVSLAIGFPGQSAPLRVGGRVVALETGGPEPGASIEFLFVSPAEEEELAARVDALAAAS